MVDAQLTLIFMIGQEVCRCLLSLYRQPILRLCITKKKSLFNYIVTATRDPSPGKGHCIFIPQDDT